MQFVKLPFENSLAFAAKCGGRNRFCGLNYSLYGYRAKVETKRELIMLKESQIDWSCQIFIKKKLFFEQFQPIHWIFVLVAFGILAYNVNVNNLPLFTVTNLYPFILGCRTIVIVSILSLHCSCIHLCLWSFRVSW